MYNRYISQDSNYGPIPPSQEGGGGAAAPRGGLGGLLGGLLRGSEGAGRINDALSSLLSGLGLPALDAGDILLALIVLLLILEDGDDLELLIALALMVALHLGER